MTNIKMETTLTYHPNPTKEDLLEYFSQRIRVRKMTPKEALRLMDFSEDSINKIQGYPFATPQEKEARIKQEECLIKELSDEIDMLKIEKKKLGKDFKDLPKMLELRKKIAEVKVQLAIIKRDSISKTQIYKQAGNSIVCSCIYHIGRTLWIPNQPENKAIKQLTIFDL